MKKLMIPTMLAVAAFACSGAAHAVTFTGYANGSWSAPTGTVAGDVFSIANNDNNTTTATSNFNFGTAVVGSTTNLFTFNGTNAISTSSEALFDLGAFTYRNGTTNNYSEITNIGLSILLHLSSPTVSDNNFTYNFGIDLTPNNTGNAVLDGDIVSIATGITSTNLVVNGTTYTLALRGFSTDGGVTTTSQFLSPENTTANAHLYATITTQTLVPEPASIALIATGLVGLGTLRRRRQNG